jgi:hypothetical protein
VDRTLCDSLCWAHYGITNDRNIYLVFAVRQHRTAIYTHNVFNYFLITVLFYELALLPIFQNTCILYTVTYFVTINSLMHTSHTEMITVVPNRVKWKLKLISLWALNVVEETQLRKYLK